ncbi:hypothetical protein QKT49_gp402 [Acanthamoeba castellanii medusavirus]|uniref:Uncharacterized protein n=1 Tax=Acanthamoeba castellanii medusavirus J1 TaxID=3114988 RepID=A0A3T1CX11_9VIRU|nr:hypothetical protein QKT49_gp402 [Acanthamoeba castellanii medusavirus]BBI30361.1 hypothetical protein [Acanthamoeba castellanii medusavirus J1]
MNGFVRAIAYDAVPVASSLVLSVGFTGLTLGCSVAAFLRFGTVLDISVLQLMTLAKMAPAWSAHIVRLYDRAIVNAGLATEGDWSEYQRVRDPLRDVLHAAVGLATPMRRLNEHSGVRVPRFGYTDSILGDILYYTLVGGLAFWVQSHCTIHH